MDHGGRLVRRPWAGATFQSVSQEIADSLGMARPAGALVSDVRTGSPAADSGLKRGDVVVAVNGQSVDDPEALGYRLATHTLGSTVTLGVTRAGKNVDVPLRLAAAPEVPARDATTITGRTPFGGATVWNLSPAVADELSLQDVPQGVVVADVEDGSAAQSVGLQKGDLILAVNDTKIATTADLKRVSVTRPGYWKLSVGRGGQVLTTVVGG